MNISIIIPNYNGEALLKKNLPKVIDAVKEYSKGTIEIIIPDDASSDHSREVIAEFILSLKNKGIVGKTMSNTDAKKSGFSANINRGVRLATGDVLIFLNSDVVPYKNFLEYLLPHFQNEKVFAVGCMDESVENGKIVLRGRGVGKWQRGFLTHTKGEVDTSNTLWVSGGSGAFRADIYRKIGGLDEIYDPFYWEDIDVSYRAQKAGYMIRFESKSKVIHEHSNGSVQENFSQFHIKKIAYRNMFFFVWINITDKNLLISHFVWLPYYCVKSILAKDFEFWVGLLLALRNLPKVLGERRKARKKFVLTDQEVLGQFTSNY